MLKRARWVLFGALAIPLGQSPRWHHFQYKNLKPNAIEQLPDSLTIRVEDSASPLFYQLPSVQFVTAIKLRGNFEGALKDEKDDFPLRLGLVVPGQKRLSWLERLFAPLWLKQLHEMDETMAVKEVRFFVLTSRDEGVKSGPHPKSGLISEEFLKKIQAGPFDIDYPVAPALPAFALWVQADGDDSHSSYTIRIDELSLKTEPVSP